MSSEPEKLEVGGSLPESVIFFDGVCNLCNASVNFVIDRDAKGEFKFAALQSEYANQQLKKAGLIADLPAQDALALDSIVLLENGSWYTKSTAALRIARRLDGAWPLVYSFVIVPKFIRDRIYAWIARKRYNWFGRLDACKIPTPELRTRFIDSA